MTFLEKLTERARGAARGAGVGAKKLASKLPSTEKVLARGGIYALGAGLLGNMAMGAIKRHKEEFDVGSSGFGGPSRSEEMLGYEQQIARYQRMAEAKAEHMRMLTDMNVQQMQQFAPDLAAALLAGKRLPNDATVIGGRKRQDLLESVGQQMASGAFGGPGGAP